MKYVAQKIIDVMATEDEDKKAEIKKSVEESHGINARHFMNDFVFEQHKNYEIPGMKNNLRHDAKEDL